MEYMKDDNAIVEDSTSDTVFIRISVHELKNQKCLQFRLNDTVWQAKQRIITAFAKDLCDALNFGLYLPPVNGRAGKFLAEERYLREYPLQGPIGFLEFKYKRRVYKLNNINIRKLRRLHSKSCLRQFLEQVRNGNVGKIVKVTNKGLDPNFHDQDSGETPLTVAVTLSKDRTKKVIIALVGGGAHIDFHNRSGLTAVHRAAIVGNVEAIKTLLDLGASPDQKDGSGFTALYYSVSNNTDLLCTEMLLQEKATIGTHDELGWSEVHQVCRYGRRQHLELLLHYGAEMDVQNASGNTPLHICAAYSQDDCAHVLLVRGVNRSILNFSSQTAFQLAILAKSVGVAELLMSFDDKNIVPIKEMPSYSDRRKGSMTPSMRALLRSRSSPRLHFDSHGSLDGRSVFNSSLSISTMHDFMPSPKDVELFVEDTSSPSLYSCTVPSICSEPETIDRVSIQEPGGGGGQANCSGRASRMDGLLRYKAKSMMDLRMEGEDAVPYGTNTLATMIRPETYVDP